MPDNNRLTDERLRQLRDDPNVCTNAGERAMAAELLELRGRIAATETPNYEALNDLWHGACDDVTRLSGLLERTRENLGDAQAEIAELKLERDQARAEAAQAVADMEPIDAIRGQLDIARRNFEGERHRADTACQARTDLAKRYMRTVATLHRVLRSRRHWQDRTIALTDALDCGCYDDEIYVPLRMATVWLPGDAPAEVSTDA